MAKFIGREQELNRLRELLGRKIASLVVIKGRRRIGKSRLIEEFAKDMQFLAFSGLPPTEGVTAKHQRDEFARQLGRLFHIPIPYSDNWGDLFWHLAHNVKNGKYVILLDEISWMGIGDPTFLGTLKNAWDLQLKKNAELILVLCGSVSSWIEKNILGSTGFVGRIDLTITLDELSLQECNEFWGAQKGRWSAYEKFKVLGITGGVPRYLEIISHKLSAEENIKRLCFTKEGFLFNEFEQLFHDLFAKRSETYKDILNCLINKPYASMDDLFKGLKMKKGGVLSDYVEELVLAGFLKRDYTWSIREGSVSKLSHLRISDNYVHFYLKYILPNRNKIARDDFLKRSLTTLPGWDVLMGLSFENLVLQNREVLHRLLNIDPNEITNDNPYFQRQTTLKSGCQIDYMIQTRFNCLYICEIKFSKKPVGIGVIREMQAKIEALAMPKNFSHRPVLVHVNGVDDEVVASEFFAGIIDFGSLLTGD